VSAGRRREGIRLIAVNVADRSRVLGEEDPRTRTRSPPGWEWRALRPPQATFEAATALLSAAMQDAESLPPGTRTGPPSSSAPEAIGMTLLEG
jgi:hypothetical protein